MPNAIRADHLSVWINRPQLLWYVSACWLEQINGELRFLDPILDFAVELRSDPEQVTSRVCSFIYPAAKRDKKAFVLKFWETCMNSDRYMQGMMSQVDYNYIWTPVSCTFRSSFSKNVKDWSCTKLCIYFQGHCMDKSCDKQKIDWWLD